MRPFRLLGARQVVILSALLLFAAGRVAADVRLPAIIGDGMVLQCDQPVVIWGWAGPGEEVSVAIGENQATTNADAKGEWMVRLAAMKASAEPVELTVTGTSGRRIKRKNVLIGEVWIGSGQSNMERAMESKFDGKPLYEGGDYPDIRLFYTPKTIASAPLADVSASWVPCSPESTRTFSAVLYHFGLHLHTELRVPVGLIQSAWGGTPIEPWTPPEGFASEPALAADLEWARGADDRYEDAKAKRLEQFAAWLAKARQAAAEGRPISAPPSWPRHPVLSHRSPTAIYNAMIHPLAPFAIRGAIWYQGEDNVGAGMHYHHQLKGLIQGWRQVWKQGDFPFYYVQLAPFKYAGDPLALPLIWEAQAATLSVPNTGMAVTVDISTIGDVHPPNKRDVGKRLALWALAGTYGRTDLVYSGPLYDSHRIEGEKIRISFKHTGGGLVSRDGKPLSWFTIAGEDRKFVEARAAIDGDTVIVSSPEVAGPVAVRFGWHQTAEPNLSNKEGLPASPFRTDRW